MKVVHQSIRRHTTEDVKAVAQDDGAVKRSGPRCRAFDNVEPRVQRPQDGPGMLSGVAATKAQAGDGDRQHHEDLPHLNVALGSYAETLMATSTPGGD